MQTKIKKGIHKCSVPYLNSNIRFLFKKKYSNEILEKKSKLCTSGLCSCSFFKSNILNTSHRIFRLVCLDNYNVPIYFQIKLLFFVFLYIKPTYPNKSTNPCVFHRCGASTFVPLRPPKGSILMTKCVFTILAGKMWLNSISLYKNI